jgi:hypothetical protein
VFSIDPNPPLSLTMPEANAGTADGNQRREEDNRSFLQKHAGTIIQMIVMWLASRYLFGGCKHFALFVFSLVAPAPILPDTNSLG